MKTNINFVIAVLLFGFTVFFMSCKKQELENPSSTTQIVPNHSSVMINKSIAFSNVQNKVIYNYKFVNPQWKLIEKNVKEGYLIGDLYVNANNEKETLFDVKEIEFEGDGYDIDKRDKRKPTGTWKLLKQGPDQILVCEGKPTNCRAEAVLNENGEVVAARITILH